MDRKVQMDPYSPLSVFTSIESEALKTEMTHWDIIELSETTCVLRLKQEGE